MSNELAGDDGIDWAQVRDDVVTRALIVIRRRCWQPDIREPREALVAAGAMADLVHSLPQLESVTRDDLKFLLPWC